MGKEQALPLSHRLYCDPAYAGETRWEGLIAPPTFLYTMGEDAAPRPTPEQRPLLKGDPFAGLGSYQAVMEFEWWRPLQLGDRCRVLQTQVGVRLKRSNFGGRTAHVVRDYLYANGRGFPERTHVHTLIYNHDWRHHRDADPVPLELSLDHNFPGLAALILKRNPDVDKARLE